MSEESLHQQRLTAASLELRYAFLDDHIHKAGCKETQRLKVCVELVFEQCHDVPVVPKFLSVVPLRP